MASVTQATSGEPVELAQRLLLSVEPLADELVSRILEGEHSYAESTLLTHDQLRHAVLDNLATILAQLAGIAPMRLAAARAAGRLKAEQGVPLAALLHAYRMAGRLIWERLLEEAGGRIVESLPQMASEVWSIIDEYSSAAADAYGQFTADRDRHDSQARSLLLSALLEGNIANLARLWDSVRTLHLPAVGTFLVVSAEVTRHGTEPLRGADGWLRLCDVHSVWAAERDARVGLLSLSSPRMLGEVHRVLVELANSRVGVSQPFDTPLGAHDALREAQLACRSSVPGAAAVNLYGGAPLPLLLAHLPEAGRQLAEQVLGPILRLADAERDILLDTLDAWYACAGSSTDAAKRLHYHRNTIHHRLRRVERLTGRSCTDPAASAELYVALQAVRLAPTDAPSQGDPGSSALTVSESG